MKFTQVSGSSNNGLGAYVKTGGTFTIVGTTSGWNWFTNNTTTGLHVEAGGAISLTKLYIGDNGLDGIYLTNTLGTAPITLTDVTSNHNTMSGLRLYTKGAVTVNTLTTNDNTEWGFHLDQTGATDSLKPIILNKVIANKNGENGIIVDAMGSITTNFLTANNNQYNGVYLKNTNSVLSV